MDNKKLYFRLMFWLAILTIIFGFVIVCDWSLLRRFMNIVLWILMLLSWISAIINAIKNKWVQYIWFLLAIWILITIFWLMLLCGRAGNFIWTLTIRLFALWALMRWCILIFNWIQKKAVQKYRLLEIIIGWLLIILSIITACNTWEAARFAWACIWISIIIDGIALCIFAFKIKNSDSIQMEIINQASQQEIWQWEIIISQTVITSDPNIDNKTPQQNN